MNKLKSRIKKSVDKCYVSFYHEKRYKKGDEKEEYTQTPERE